VAVSFFVSPWGRVSSLDIQRLRSSTSPRGERDSDKKILFKLLYDIDKSLEGKKKI